MNPATKEMIRLTLSNDVSVPPEVSMLILEILDGHLPNSADNIEGSLLLTLKDAASLLGVCRMTFWRMVRDEVFRPVEITPGVFRYRRKDIVAYANRISDYQPVKRGSKRRKKAA